MDYGRKVFCRGNRPFTLLFPSLIPAKGLKLWGNEVEVFPVPQIHHLEIPAGRGLTSRSLACHYMYIIAVCPEALMAAGLRLHVRRRGTAGRSLTSEAPGGTECGAVPLGPPFSGLDPRAQGDPMAEAGPKGLQGRQGQEVAASRSCRPCSPLGPLCPFCSSPPTPARSAAGSGGAPWRGCRRSPSSTSGGSGCGCGRGRASCRRCRRTPAPAAPPPR
jgi:hypothetical protein